MNKNDFMNVTIGASATLSIIGYVFDNDTLFKVSSGATLMSAVIKIADMFISDKKDSKDVPNVECADECTEYFNDENEPINSDSEPINSDSTDNVLDEISKDILADDDSEESVNN